MHRLALKQQDYAVLHPDHTVEPQPDSLAVQMHALISATQQ
jgi:hypothetical protein